MRDDGPGAAEGVTFRRAASADVPRLTHLIAAANLPPLFIEEFLDGFVVAQKDGAIIGCGGVEMCEESAVVRSVVVDEASRGLKLGARIADLLEGDARAAGATDIYLFTADALPFWQHRGYTTVTFDDWALPPRMCWQYQFLSQNQDLVGEVHTMWRRAEVPAHARTGAHA